MSHYDIDGIKANVRDNATGMYAYAQRQVDRVVSPDARRKAYDQTASFASAKPLLFVREIPSSSPRAPLSPR